MIKTIIMYRIKYLWIFIVCSMYVKYVQGQPDSHILVDTAELKDTHDLLLPQWGPYSTKYAGISYIDKKQQGMRFDFTVLPRIFNSKVIIPNVRKQAGYHPWEANRELTKYTYRYELEWKDNVFVDVIYRIIDTTTALAEIRFVNNTALPVNLGADLISFVNYPYNYPLTAIRTPKRVLWKNAVEYKSLEFARQRPTKDLVYDGWIRGEIRDSNYINGRAIGRNFGRDKGDKVSYRFDIGKNQLKGGFALRYKMKSNSHLTLHLSGIVNQKINLKGTGKFTWVTIPYDLLSNDVKTLTLKSDGNSEIVLNGFLFIPPDENPNSYIVQQERHLVPMTEEIEENVFPSRILKYKDVSSFFGIEWDQKDYKIREIRDDKLEPFFQMQLGIDKKDIFNGEKEGHYDDISIGPFALEAFDVKTSYVMLSTGSYNQVRETLGRLNTLKEETLRDENAIVNVRGSLANETSGILSEGKKYLFSQQLLRATLMTNIIYPIYTQDTYIRNFAPGKWWNSLYTWDAGFNALGLIEINPNLAAECINTYTTPLESQSAFILHGTPVPTQIYAFFDLWNKTQSHELLLYFYPRLKKYYEFLSGRLGSSTTRKFKSNILTTWDYFYNAGGWDDYPPQSAVHNERKESTIAPAAPTAVCIRTAKMLRMAAVFLDRREDIETFNEDIKAFSNALQEYSWDSTSGYFSYVVHNQKGYPIGHFKDTNDVNFNMGLGGVYPLLSGICSASQQNKLIDKIFSPQHLWTSAGISTVDKSAPYFKVGGYWNGTVWMPHQWFFWKTMLDINRSDLAFEIAKKALNVYKTEIDASYNSFEHFSTINARGGGWHQFSGLSSPILNWFSAYYKIGSVTTGFETWINSQRFNINNSSYEATLSFDNATPAHQRSILVCMNPYYNYHVTFNGKEIPVTSPYEGLLEITLPATNKKGVLRIKTF